MISTEGNDRHTPYGQFCLIHVRAYLPEPRLRQTKFLCIRCDREVDPTTQPWTSKEYDLNAYPSG